MSKTLGQVAYEAADLAGWRAPWEQLHDANKAQWQAAAEAVVKAAPVSEARSLAEIAVIEAAKEVDVSQLVSDIRRGYPIDDDQYRQLDALGASLEALQELEE